MPTLAQNPGDILWLNQLSNAAFSVGEAAALAAAVTLSAANANTVVQIFIVDQVATAPTGLTLANVQIVPQAPTPKYFVQLASSGGTVVGLAATLVAAYALSAANANIAVNICRLYVTATAP